MIIRLARPADTPALARLFTEAVHRVSAAHYTSEQLRVWAPQPPDVARWQKRLAGLFTLVAEHEASLLGFASLAGSDVLDLLYVHPEYLRQGIARALHERIEAEARRRGARRLHTDASITAQRFFESMGMRVIAEQQVEQSGVRLTNFRMEKELVPDPGSA